MIAIGVLILLGVLGGSTLVFMRSPVARLSGMLRSARGRHEQIVSSLQRERSAKGTRLRHACDAHALSWRERLFQDLPAESLKQIGAGGVRWSALQSSGVDSLYDLLQRRATLQEIHGVGEVSAARLLEAAERAEDALETLPIPPPRFDSDDEMAAQLFDAAASELGIRDVADEFESEIERTKLELESLAHDAPGIMDWVQDPSGAGERARDLKASVRELEARIDELSESLSSRLDGLRRPSTLTRTDEVRELIEDSLPGEVTYSKYGQGLLEDEARSIDAIELRIPHFAATLRTYQRFGARFMIYYRRTLIGDEMGLGKTIQALAAISHLKDRGASHFLVVAPAGVIYNWAHESIDKAGLSSIMLHGEAREQALDLWVKRGGLAITSYATLRAFDLASRIERLDMLVADEAHYVKNPEAQRSQAVWELAVKADFVSFMTGTPIENRVQEFVRLIQPLDHQVYRKLKGMLGLTLEDVSGEAAKMLASEVAGALVSEALSSDPATTVAMGLLREARGQFTDYVVAPTAFRRLVRHVYLRRTQRDVLTELPEAILKSEWVELKPVERSSYNESVRSRAFMTMRRVASTGAGHAGAKFTHLDRLLADYRARRQKVVIFSYFRDTLDALEALPEVAGRIDGSVSAAMRSEVIGNFWSASGHAVLLGQVKSAGVGINLQCATVVVLMEPQIKPSLEDQAIARVVRMGQKHRVMVHRFIAEHTVEEHLESMLHGKRAEFELYAQESMAKEAHDDATDAGLEKKIVEIEYTRVLREAPLD